MDTDSTMHINIRAQKPFLARSNEWMVPFPAFKVICASSTTNISVKSSDKKCLLSVSTAEFIIVQFQQRNII